MIAGQPEKALEKYTLALGISPDVNSSHMRARAIAYAVLGRFYHRFKDVATYLTALKKHALPEARGILFRCLVLHRVSAGTATPRRGSAEGLAAAQQKNDESGAAHLTALTVLIAYERGDFAKAIAAAEPIERALPAGTPPALRQAVQVLAGAAKARSGKRDTAQAELAEVRKRCDPKQPPQVWFCHALEGEITLAADDPAAAEAAFAAGEPATKMTFNRFSGTPLVFMNGLPSRDGIARVKAARGDLKGAIEDYRKLITPDISAKWTAVLEPRYVLALARLLERAGDAAGARKQDGRFAQLRKGADAGLPELAEARRKAAGP